MLTLTTEQHLARIGARLTSGKLDDAEYNDIAVIALHYQIHAKDAKYRNEAAALYDMAVTMRAYWYPQTERRTASMSEQDEQARDIANETLWARMKYLAVTDYEVRDGIVYWHGQDIGAAPYLNSRSMEQLAGILDRARKQGEGK